MDDPILGNLDSAGEMMVAGLGTDLAARRRVKFFGRVADGMRRVGKNDGMLQVILKIEQTLWNCPKYITARQVAFAPTTAPTRPEERTANIKNTLSHNALELIQTADIFFITTRNGEKDMDTNLRGGPPGFVRILPSSSTSTPTTIIWPEYSGNRLYQTLGNLAVNPEAGITFTDFVTGDILYLTGITEIITLETGLSHILPRSNLAVKFTFKELRYLEAVLPIRESLSDVGTREFSPYNPPVRYLSSEKAQPLPEGNSLKAKLVHISAITPKIAIFRFSLSSPHAIQWKAGQYVALEFEDRVGHAKGYRHMNNSDPKSLNDDYVRTFTVISRPENNGIIEILVRKVGVVTGWMFALIGNKRKIDMGVEIPVRGFGGEFSISHDGKEQINFVAGGVGITPLLSFLDDKNWSGVNVWWTLRIGDVGMVEEILRRYPGLGQRLKVFITGGSEHDLEGLQGIKVFWRRIEKGDLAPFEEQSKAKWYLCASPELRKKFVNWLEGKEGQEVFWEDFGY